MQLMELEKNLPTNKFEQILYLEDAANKMKDILSKIEARIAETKQSIVMNGVIDSTYHLEPVFGNRLKSELDEDKFKEDYPNVYDRILSIKASDAEKLLGKTKLKDLVIDEVGWDKFEEVASLNITDVRKAIPASEHSKYITESYPQVGLIVVKND